MPLVKFGGRKLLLSASDLVLPLCCGIVLHLFFVISLFVTHYFLSDQNCAETLYWFIYLALGCHALIVLINFIGTWIAVRLKVMDYSNWLTHILHIRAVLNFMDIGIAIFGLYLLFVGDLKCLESTPYILVFVSVIINWIILLIGFCGVCCLSVSDKKTGKNNGIQMSQIDDNDINHHETFHGHIRSSSVRNLHKNDVTAKKIESGLRTICCACFWENRAWNHGEVGIAFNEMTSLMEILTQTHHINNEHIHNLAPSDIFTGLQLYRMLQKHYQIHDLGFYKPYKANNYQHKFVDIESKDVLLEIAKKNNNGTRTGSDNDFVALQDNSMSDDHDKQDKEDKNKSASIIPPMDEDDVKDENECNSPSKSISNTPESPLLESNNNGFGTFDDEVLSMNDKNEYQAPVLSNICIDKPDDDKTRINNIETVQSYLHHGMQPKLSECELHRVKEGVYFSKYAIASYGLPLYTLEYPCGICCAPPCCLPNGMSRDRIYGKACCGLSSIKVFLRRSGINGCDLLLASQFSGLNQITFFIAIDGNKKKLVIAIRGSESMPDGVIDANCKPTKCETIDNECYCHDGFKLSMLKLFESLENHQLTQEFLANNKDFGIVVVGHSLGSGVSVLLTLQLLMNKGKNRNYMNRDIHCYGIASPLSINTVYADKIKKLTEKHVTVFIYGKDMVPRLQWNTVMKAKCAIIRLLTECDQSAWWIYRQGLICDDNTILTALKDTSNYVLHPNINTNDVIIDTSMPKLNKLTSSNMIIEEGDENDIDNEEEEEEEEEKQDQLYREEEEEDDKHLRYLQQLRSVHRNFMRDINSDIKELSHLTVKKNIGFGPSLWNIKLQQIGMVFHIVNGHEVNININRNKRGKGIVCCSCLCVTICNCFRCKCCNPGSINPLKTDNYIIYRADPKGFNEIVVSSRMASDHMPHVYKDVLNSLDLTNLDKLTFHTKNIPFTKPKNPSNLYPFNFSPRPQKRKKKSFK